MEHWLVNTETKGSPIGSLSLYGSWPQFFFHLNQNPPQCRSNTVHVTFMENGCFGGEKWVLASSLCCCRLAGTDRAGGGVGASAACTQGKLGAAVHPRPSHLPSSLARSSYGAGQWTERTSGDLSSHLSLPLPGHVTLNKPFPTLRLCVPI